MGEWTDRTTTVAELKAAVERFAAERCWERYHTPKNLAVSAAIEAAELLECFQWLTPAEAESLDEEARRHAGEEIADVLSYLLGLCTKLDIDLSAAFEDKMRKNALKYPAGTTRSGQK